MYAVVLALHLLVCLGLIAVVLVQSGKGGGLAGGAFGGSAQTVFGGRGATDFITRATMVLGGLFFATSLSLALMSSGLGPGQNRSLIQEEARRGAQTAPAPVPTPGAQPPAGGTTPPPAGGQPPPPGTTPPGGGR